VSEPTPPQYDRGERVNVRHTYGLTYPEWRTGTITDMFIAPITGTWVYVVAGCGYYDHEVRTYEDLPAEPQSLRA
jgi:hypothetical protein